MKMSSDQKPETWGYGLTWLVIIGLAVMIGYGAVKLRKSAKDNYAALSKQKIEAEARAKAAAAKEDARVKALQLLEDLGPQPTVDDIAKTIEYVLNISHKAVPTQITLYTQYDARKRTKNLNTIQSKL